jgi:2-polyprenyl-6-hydroxyphenyl methylase/3-demethylubiquinone-9 3-methyltransferase
MGCGHGLFAHLIGRTHPNLTVVGVDIDPRKIAAAKRSAHLGKVYFVQADLMTLPVKQVDSVTLIDVLYLVPFEQWEELLRNIYTHLRPKGRLLIKTMDPYRRVKFWWAVLQETLAVKVLKITYGYHFFFMKREDLTRLLAAVGFKTRAVPLDRGYPYPHILYVCDKGDE